MKTGDKYPRQYLPKRSLWSSAKADYKIWFPLSFLCAVVAAYCFNGYSFVFSDLLKYPVVYKYDALFHFFLTQRVIEGWVFDNFRSGYPFGSTILDYPFSDTANFFILKLLGLLTGSFYGAYNAFLILGFSLAFAAAYLVMRSMDIGKPFAVSLSVLYAFLPFHWIRINHLFLTYYWMAPVYFYFALLCFSRFKNGAFSKRTIKKAAFYGICLAVLSSFGVYYAVFGILTIFVCAFSASLLEKSYRNFVLGLFFIACITFGVCLNVLPNLYYKHTQGENFQVAARGINDTEIYGLKISHMFVPPKEHRFSKFERLGEKYYNDISIKSESGTYLGIAGFAGFLILLLSIFLSNMGIFKDFRVNVLGSANLFILLFATIGGFSSVFSLLISPMIRGWNRTSVFISFFALAALALALQWSAGKISAAIGGNKAVKNIVTMAVCIAVVCGGGYDSYAKKMDVNTSKGVFISDKKIVERVEAMLPEGAAVYQLPYHAFPEVPPIYELPAYEEGKGFIYSKKLLWNWGGMKFRPGDIFYRSLASLEMHRQIEIAKNLGFAGILVFRKGYPDKGAAAEKEIAGFLGKSPDIVSEDGNISFFKINEGLPRFSKPADILEVLNVSGMALEEGGFGIREGKLVYKIDLGKNYWPPVLKDMKGFSGAEGWGRWSDAAEAPGIKLEFNAALPKNFKLVFAGHAFGPNSEAETKIKIGSEEKGVLISNEWGEYELEFATDGKVDTIEITPAFPVSPASFCGSNDPRLLGIGLSFLTIEEI